MKILDLLKEVREDYVRMALVPRPDPLVQDVAIANVLSSGALMDACSLAWRTMLTQAYNLPGGEFAVGPSRTSVECTLDQLDAAITELEAADDEAA